MKFEIEDCTCLAESEKAILVDGPDFDKPVWIPQSQIHDDSEVYTRDTSGTLVVSRWFAKQRGWE